MRRLALLGGTPAFPDGVPFVRPPVPPLTRVTQLLEPSWERGILTNGPLVRRLEERASEVLAVRHVVAVSSCTTGLMLALRALVPSGDVLVPSFTFSASAHAIAWNGGTPRFVECDERSFQMDMHDASLHADGTVGIVATHVFGAPCNVEAVEQLAADARVPVVFDAAHAFGTQRSVVPVARFGDASVFSLTPTKPLVAGEGGLVATESDAVARSVRLGRDYGNPGDYNTEFVGLNGRMSEMHAAVALASLEHRERAQAGRDRVVARYRSILTDVPGIRFQRLDPNDVSTWKDVTIAVDTKQFGVSRDLLREALRREGIDTRTYFDPPAHRQRAYAHLRASLPVTDRVASCVLSLPISPSLNPQTVERIAEVIASVHLQADAIHAELVA
jgi:dTDP-4-amino-4,6-dideoxygalactose transaminase